MTSSWMYWVSKPVNDTRRASFSATLIGIALLLRQQGPVSLNALPTHLQPELIEAAERGQIRAREGSIRHVEVFQLGVVRTPIIARPRPLPRQRRADHLYTLNYEEPFSLNRLVP
ncbi:hypothetical protein [Mycobacterium simulans]|uniref:hypothetical protein n=1 Tax=Mycobacterium simulans TaxID=627089 RepID=UPI00163F4654|nr:hypothetical protein [Mycobacterium simulans]